MPSSAEKKYQVDGQACRVADLGSTVAVVVTHPWGPLGGNLHNNVVVAAVLYFQRLGISTCRFDFCGSQIGRGYDQVEQCRKVTEKLLQGAFTKSKSTPPKHIILIGYSYGSLITMSASADIPQCIASIAISPPFGVQMWLLMFASEAHLTRAAVRTDLPRLFVSGDQDNFTAEARVRVTVEQRFPTDTVAIVQGADHFWRRRESDALGVVGQWLLSTFADHCNGRLAALCDFGGVSPSEK